MRASLSQHSLGETMAFPQTAGISSSALSPVTKNAGFCFQGALFQHLAHDLALGAVAACASCCSSSPSVRNVNVPMIGLLGEDCDAA
jgi:hypothetical protein